MIPNSLLAHQELGRNSSNFVLNHPEFTSRAPRTWNSSNSVLNYPEFTSRTPRTWNSSNSVLNDPKSIARTLRNWWFQELNELQKPGTGFCLKNSGYRSPTALGETFATMTRNRSFEPSFYYNKKQDYLSRVVMVTDEKPQTIKL